MLPRMSKLDLIGALRLRSPIKYRRVSNAFCICDKREAPGEAEFESFILGGWRTQRFEKGY